jgi:hypothetical protein
MNEDLVPLNGAGGGNSIHGSLAYIGRRVVFPVPQALYHIYTLYYHVLLMHDYQVAYFCYVFANSFKLSKAGSARALALTLDISICVFWANVCTFLLGFRTRISKFLQKFISKFIWLFCV